MALNQSLLLILEVSRFNKFLNDVEIVHYVQTIRKLLKIIIKGNT